MKIFVSVPKDSEVMNTFFADAVMQYLEERFEVSYSPLERQLKKEEIPLYARDADVIMVGHACIAETMFLMGVAPELVRLDRADDSGLGVYKNGVLRMDHLKDLQCPFTWHANFPNHYQGTNPGKCTPQMGELAKEYMLNRVISFIQAAKNDEEALKISDEMGIPKR